MEAACIHHSIVVECPRRDSNSHPFRDGILSPVGELPNPNTSNDLASSASSACRPASCTDLAETIDAQLRQAGLSDFIRAAIVDLIRAAITLQKAP